MTTKNRSFHQISHMFPSCDAEAAQAYSAVQRISGFFDRDTRACERGVRRSNDVSCAALNAPLVLENATFYIGRTEAPLFQVGRFNLSVRKSEVLAVCGPVGGEFTVQVPTYYSEYGVSLFRTLYHKARTAQLLTYTLVV